MSGAKAYDAGAPAGGGPLRSERLGLVLLLVHAGPAAAIDQGRQPESGVGVSLMQKATVAPRASRPASVSAATTRSRSAA